MQHRYFLRVAAAMATAVIVVSGANVPALASEAGEPSLIVIDVTARGLLEEHELPVIWKGASFLLAEWDPDLQRTARRLSVPFDVLATGLDRTRQIYLFELDGDEPPQEWRDHILFRRGRSWIVELDAGQATAWTQRGYRVMVLERRARGWRHPAALVPYDCSVDPLIVELLDRTSAVQWLDWIEKLSGEESVIVGGEESTILTRYSSPMFSGAPDARGYDFALEQVEAMHYGPSAIEEDPYAGFGGETWKNLIVTLPGQSFPDEIVAVTAHLDSINQGAGSSAPGADDNGTGSAILFEAARLLRQFRFQRTIKIIWFTGEEDGLIGSEAYVDDHAMDDFVGVVNLDMYGWDGDADRCFEIHAGTLPQSIDVANCFRDNVTAYDLGLTYDFLTTGATDRSDHASFWQVDVGAIEIAENFFNDGLPGGCIGQDRNPNYHTADDTVDGIEPDFAFDIARTGLATIAAMAVPIEACFDDAPVLTATAGVSAVSLEWTPLAGAATYRVLRSTRGCEGQWMQIGETAQLVWLDEGADEATTYYYRIEAVAADGTCVSAASACEAATPTIYNASTTQAQWIDVCASGGPGSGNGIVDPGESVLAPVTLENDGNAALSSIAGVLSTSDEEIQIIDPFADWPDLAPGGQALSRPNHVGFQTSPTVPCGTTVETVFGLAYAEGSNDTSLVVTIGDSNQGQRLHSEFSAGIPFGWQVIDGGSGGGSAATWTTDNPGNRSIGAPFAGDFAIVDSDEAGSGATQDEQLITSTFDASDCSEVLLEFSNQFHWYGGSDNEFGDVDVTVDGGGSWINVLRLQSGDDGYSTPNSKSVDITPAIAANPGAVRIRFYYHQAEYEWWWAIDNVTVRCAVPQCNPCAGPVGPPGEAGMDVPLTLRREAASLVLEWGAPEATCANVDYAVYKGDLTTLAEVGYDHGVVLSCATGVPSLSISESDPRIGPTDYYLVVADNGLQEGSYGRRSTGAERPASSAACHAAQNLLDCPP